MLEFVGVTRRDYTGRDYIRFDYTWRDYTKCDYIRFDYTWRDYTRRDVLMYARIALWAVQLCASSLVLCL